MSHNKIIKIMLKSFIYDLLLDNNQRYKISNTKPNDNIISVIYQNTADFVYSAE